METWDQGKILILNIYKLNWEVHTQASNRGRFGTQRYFRRPNRWLTNSSQGRRLNSSSDMGVTQRSVLKTLSPTCEGKRINIYIYKRTSRLKWHSGSENVTFHPGTSFIITASSSRFSRSSRKVLKRDRSISLHWINKNMRIVCFITFGLAPPASEAIKLSWLPALQSVGVCVTQNTLLLAPV